VNGPEHVIEIDEAGDYRCSVPGCNGWREVVRVAPEGERIDDETCLRLGFMGAAGVVLKAKEDDDEQA
jgi:hypothetical protein